MAGFYPDVASERILVKNIPSTTTRDKLVIHFQQKKHGGCGDVRSVTFPKSRNEPGQAVVEFECHETLKSVLQHRPHHFHGQLLEVSVFPEQLFGATEAAICDMTIQRLHAHASAVMHIEESTGAKIYQAGDKHYVKGHWYQVSAAVELIELFINDATAPNQSNIRQSVAAVKMDPTNQTQIVSLMQKRETSSKTCSKKEIAVDGNVYAYMKICHPNESSKIIKHYGVNLKENNSKVIFSSKMSSANVKAAAERFEILYKGFRRQIKSCELDLRDLPNAISAQQIDQVLKSIMAEKKIHVGRIENTTKLLFLAFSKSDAESGVRKFRSIFTPAENTELASCKVLGSDLRVVAIHGDFRREKVGGLKVVLSEVNPDGVGKIVPMLSDDLRYKVAQWVSYTRSYQGTLILPTEDRGIGFECLHYIFDHRTSKADLENRLLAVLEHVNTCRIHRLVVPVDCMGGYFQSKDLCDVFKNVLSGFATTRRAKSLYLTEVRLVHGSLIEAQQLADILDEIGPGEASSEAGSQSSRKSSEKKEKEDCPICLDEMSGETCLKTLPCNHTFHQQCVDKAFAVTKKCPMCMRYYGKPEGTQPKGGTMNTFSTPQRLPGYSCDTIVINYDIPSGIQGPEHPNPGQRYTGVSRTAYLPNNPQGRELVLLLRKAFEARLIFTVGRSVTTGMDNCVTWNDIHHKTQMHGGPTAFGYPDPLYLTRLREEITEKGITL